MPHAQIAAFISAYNGRWPTKNDKSSLVGRRSRRSLIVRRARWSGADRTLSLVIGREMAPPSDCFDMFIYVPPTPDAPPLLFADNVPPAAGASLDRVAAGAVQRKTALSVLVDQSVDAIASALSLNSDPAALKIWIPGGGQRRAEHIGGGLGGALTGGQDPRDVQPCHEILYCDPCHVPDIRDFARTRPRSLDLLINLASASLKSFRRATVLDPFPSCFCTDGGQDFSKMARALAQLPPVHAIASGEEVYI
jgi:hypothetical protein